jgi:hypothetical protein
MRSGALPRRNASEPIVVLLGMTRTLILARRTAVVGLGLFILFIAVVYVDHELNRRCSRVPATTKLEVLSLSLALEQYVEDEHVYPGADIEAGPNANHFPRLFNALFGERPPAGPGGRSAPYTRVEETRISVPGQLVGSLSEYVHATGEEIRDPRVEKYLLDPWGNPYVYRANHGRALQPWMKNSATADIYSCGPDGVDDTAAGASEDVSDDIGNW